MLDIHDRLRKGRLLRAVGATHTEIAAYAIADGATVVRYAAQHVGTIRFELMTARV